MIGSSVVRPKSAVALIDRFVKDKAYPESHTVRDRRNIIPDCIDGCSAVELAVNGDERGLLVELGTTRDDPIGAFVHIYQVFAEPGSLRGWVYHARQYDRLAYTNGRLKVVLHDLRKDSPTVGKTNVLMVGEDRQVLLTIAPFVAHCVENVGTEVASFVNMPTRVFDLADPDKYRLPVASRAIPYPGK